MAHRFPPLKKLAPLHETQKHAQASMQAPLEKIDSTPSFERSRSTPIGPAQRRQAPAQLLRLEPRPLSAYDDNPVFDAISAARFLGLTAACLKKLRQRQQGPDYIQYGNNGPVRYELKTLQGFRDTHRVNVGN